MRDPRSIVITGASSGIGEALARAYAAPGIALALTGRDSVRLSGVAAACRDAGATVTASTVDVTDREGMAAWLAEVDAAAPVDLLIANAGIGVEGASEAEATRKVLAVNLDGTINTVLPLLDPMRRRGRGQIALMASLASFVGLPEAAAYNASKAAVRVWGESLRAPLRRQGIVVSVICPGFVTSRMTAKNRFRMPFLMSAERAAGIIRRGLARGSARIAFPLPTKAAIWLATALPGGVTARLMGG